jgi:NAD(P)-dependent dehydrogenase (short-subunit alcohol dehydrogenase family)
MNTHALWDLRGKVVLVTGGNAGIGLGCARGLARAGCDVAIWGRRADRNDEAARELAEHGVRVHTESVDVSDEARVVDAMAALVDAMGRVDGVICNAGLMSSAGSFLGLTSDEYHGLLAVNQHGVFYVARAAARHMKDRFDAGDPGGSLLFCASLSARTGTVGMQHYNAAKGAIVSLARGIAVEGGRYGVRCNVVCPGYTLNETVVDPGPDSAFGRHVRARTPIPRFGTPEDFEGIAVYFMSDASRFHTGDTVTIDGGWMANAGKSDLSTVVAWD